MNKIVIFKENGRIYSTSLENYNARIRNHYLYTEFKGVETLEQAKHALIKWCKIVEKNIIIKED